MKGINWFGWNTFLDATGEFHFFPFHFSSHQNAAASLSLARKRKKNLSHLFSLAVLQLSNDFRKLHQRRRRGGAGRRVGHGPSGDDGLSFFPLDFSNFFELFFSFIRKTRKKNPPLDPSLPHNTATQGFNAVRLPFRFKDVAPGRRPYNYTRLCGVPSQDDAKASSVVPPASSKPMLLPAATRVVAGKNGAASVKVPLRLPAQDFPDIPPFAGSTKGVCNARMPQLDSRERFLWNVELLIGQVREEERESFSFFLIFHLTLFLTFLFSLPLHKKGNVRHARLPPGHRHPGS